jgi:hypothetical protein
LMLFGVGVVVCPGIAQPASRIIKGIIDFNVFIIGPFPGMKNAPKTLYNLIVPRRYV